MYNEHFLGRWRCQKLHFPTFYLKTSEQIQQYWDQIMLFSNTERICKWNHIVRSVWFWHAFLLIFFSFCLILKKIHLTLEHYNLELFSLNNNVYKRRLFLNPVSNWISVLLNDIKCELINMLNLDFYLSA